MLAHTVVHRAHRFALAHDLCRDALPDFALRPPVLNQRLRRPGKHIDETRSDREPLCVDNRLRCGRLEIADTRNPVAANCNISLPRLGAGAVVNHPVPNDDVETGRCRRWGLALCEHCKHNCQERGDPKKNFFHYRATVSNTDLGAKINGYQTAVLSAVLSRLLVCRLRREQRVLQELAYHRWPPRSSNGL